MVLNAKSSTYYYDQLDFARDVGIQKFKKWCYETLGINNGEWDKFLKGDFVLGNTVKVISNYYSHQDGVYLVEPAIIGSHNVRVVEFNKLKEVDNEQ